MASANTQLQAALAQFAGQPGVSADQVSQLRATLAADQDLTQRLNSEAANGHLTGFALGASGSEPLTGSYEKSTGVITLPALDPGSGPSTDLRAALRLQEMSVRFAHSTYLDANQQSQPVTQNMVTNLQATINGSPALAREMKTAVTTVDTSARQPHMLLENFAPLSGTVAGGTFNPATNTMSLPPTALAQPPSRFNQISANDLTFVLGHETQHAFNQIDTAAAYRRFDQAATAIAKDNNPINDYTVPIENLIASNRQDEAKAQIAGWNALADRVRQSNPHVDATAMKSLGNGRIDDFVELNPSNPLQAQARQGITFNADGSLPMTPQNVSAQETYYFNKQPRGTPGLPTAQTTGIGFHGDSDYPNYYGAGAVSRAIYIERTHAHPVGGTAPQMHLDMQRLRFKEPLLEHNGIDLSQTGAANPQPYWDTSTNPPARGLFQHTQGMHQHVSPAFDLAAPSDERSGRSQHPSIDSALLEKVRQGVSELDRQAGKPWDDNSERLSASLMLMAAEKGFTAKDDLKFAFNTPTPNLGSGEVLHMWRASDASPDPAANRAHMPTQEALSVPAEQRLTQVETLQQAKAEEIQRNQQQDVVQQQSGQARSL
ncbi:hypothetical protein LLE67_15590 [Xanthomonas campestris]|uniref:XVIPCD domain-containing protein n=1 Tax=Xanthomonas campestris TaxID=339 RepID=UPI001E5DAFA2|nr:XVIPCD domain-containing protein [Xanthomonas campestris]MCC5069244.1 hypothetical protein [Xanthomonas campestris]